MIKITAADGHLVPNKAVLQGSDSLVVMSHGITTGKDEDGLYTEFAEQLLAPSFDSIRFDFRGHGESTIPSKQATVAGELLDFMAVMKWARESGHGKLFHLATSFGASVTLLAVSRFSFRDLSAVAFWNPVISYHNTFIKPKVEWAREFFDHKTEEELAYRTGTRVSETDFFIGPQMTMELLLLQPEKTIWPPPLPLLIFHGDADTCAPFSDADEYVIRNRDSARLHRVRGVDHGFDDKIQDVFQQTVLWFREHA
jgi:pimeloyl-ACP methyl ester carboxylesterase